MSNFVKGRLRRKAEMERHVGSMTAGAAAAVQVRGESLSEIFVHGPKAVKTHTESLKGYVNRLNQRRRDSVTADPRLLPAVSC